MLENVMASSVDGNSSIFGIIKNLFNLSAYGSSEVQDGMSLSQKIYQNFDILSLALVDAFFSFIDTYYATRIFKVLVQNIESMQAAVAGSNEMAIAYQAWSVNSIYFMLVIAMVVLGKNIIRIKRNMVFNEKENSIRDFTMRQSSDEQKTTLLTNHANARAESPQFGVVKTFYNIVLAFYGIFAQAIPIILLNVQISAIVLVVYSVVIFAKNILNEARIREQKTANDAQATVNKMQKMLEALNKNDGIQQNTGSQEAHQKTLKMVKDYLLKEQSHPNYEQIIDNINQIDEIGEEQREAAAKLITDENKQLIEIAYNDLIHSQANTMNKGKTNAKIYVVISSLLDDAFQRYYPLAIQCYLISEVIRGKLSYSHIAFTIASVKNLFNVSKVYSNLFGQIRAIHSNDYKLCFVPGHQTNIEEIINRTVSDDSEHYKKNLLILSLISSSILCSAFYLELPFTLGTYALSQYPMIAKLLIDVVISTHPAITFSMILLLSYTSTKIIKENSIKDLKGTTLLSLITGYLMFEAAYILPLVISALALMINISSLLYASASVVMASIFVQRTNFINVLLFLVNPLLIFTEQFVSSALHTPKNIGEQSATVAANTLSSIAPTLKSVSGKIRIPSILPFGWFPS